MAHARLGPSSAQRWLQCPASIFLSEKLPPKPSGPAAEAGTLMHDVFERRMLNQGDFSAKELDRLAQLEVSERRARQIVGDAITAAYTVLRRYGLEEFMTETRVNPGERLGRFDYWGTADLIAANADSGILLVGDLKTGRGRVDVEFNDQLLSYALGALALIDFKPRQIVLAIFQPPIHGGMPVTWETTLETVEAFAQFASKRASLTDDATTAPQPSQDACMWCPARSVCPIHEPL